MPTVYRNFSALKLLDIDKRFHIFERTNARTVLDLAGAPGGFSQVALEQMMLLHYHHAPSFSPKAPTPSEHDFSKKRKVASSCFGRDVSLSSLPPLVISVDQRHLHPLHAPHSLRLQANIEDICTLQRLVDAALGNIPAGDACAPPTGVLSTTGLSPPVKRPVEVVLHDGVCVVAGQNSFSVSYAQNQMVLQVLRFTCQFFSHQLTSGCWTSKIASSPSLFSAASSSSQESNSLSSGSFSRSRPLRGTKREDSAHSAANQVPLISFSSQLPVAFVSKVFQSSHFPGVLQAFRTFFNDVAVHTPLIRWKNDFSSTSGTKAMKQLEAYVVANGFRVSKWLQYVKAQRLHGEKQNHRNAQRERSGYSQSKRDPLSMPPYEEDLSHGKSFFWRCVGCQQLRFGVAPCPSCSE